MDPDRSLEREDVLTLLGAIPERVSDVVAAFPAEFLEYRHGPAFPTLGEILVHLAETSQRIDTALRHAYLDGAETIEVRACLDIPFDAPAQEPDLELLHTYIRIRRRTVDLLRGLTADELERVLHDSASGELSLLDVCRLVVTHELGHLTQIRSLVSLLPEPQDLGPLPETNSA
jgi:uncharacterized damage-inducible protein DinB